MDEHDAGIISFYDIAEILNQNLHREGFGDRTDTTTFLIMNDLTGYFKTLKNTGFNEKEFKKLCLK